MDPGRRAMLSGRQERPSRDVTSPRRDDGNRVSKRSDQFSSGRRRKNNARDANTTSLGSNRTYMTQDEQALQFVAEEDKFVLKQSKKKADIRVREGRAKPIDLLAFNLRFVDPDRDVLDDDETDARISVPSPEAVLQTLDEAQLRELESDITSYHTLETNARNREYWQALQSLCADRRQKLKPQGTDDRVVSTVAADIDKILSPKTYEQLEALERQVKAKLRSDEDIDTDYWEQLLRSLLGWKAKAKVKKVYEEIKESRAALLKMQGIDVRPEEIDGATGGTANRRLSSSFTSTPASTAAHHTKPPPTAVSLLQQHGQSQSSSSASASASASAPPGTARFAPSGDDDFSGATKALYEREAARGTGENEEVFAEEEAVPAASRPAWAGKYRPRKPRYFNRVQMGYEWNKYNQTHYDHDNPPPKVVQGYRFNIFYPELIDKTKAPTYKIIREGGRRRGESSAPAGENDTCLIRFIAGPPYEDIAFRIVDREWDYSAKKDRGFRSSFDKGILQLHFQFKKIYYRK
ncbi:hypothetical protein SODALDRAFT_322880 [Sodiomyces alkalinus F11]|uniref:Splicing factor Cactin n=1 Tax=Sodiomyces alkalinus (strain CBS 110278 / VKM F-3762 / F11) TaxID=1314773 RepID=A0A3N2PYR0_SODAK|nr:hypothetical protein SODALDRAFT_322880 [Sodiomyces alkalinus F11]ROT39485.1 hypothetical protein SODALDRAFT_322880 [Sodiomyces alkalinus F11]